jgi:hypothetical protein
VQSRPNAHCVKQHAENFSTFDILDDASAELTVNIPDIVHVCHDIREFNRDICSNGRRPGRLAKNIKEAGLGHHTRRLFNAHVCSGSLSRLSERPNDAMVALVRLRLRATLAMVKAANTMPSPNLGDRPPFPVSRRQCHTARFARASTA